MLGGDGDGPSSLENLAAMLDAVRGRYGNIGGIPGPDRIQVHCNLAMSIEVPAANNGGLPHEYEKTDDTI